MQEKNTDQWKTPDSEWTPLNMEFGFTIDVAADSSNTKVQRFYDIETDGLKQDWSNEVVWCNPPYSNVAPWVKKASESQHKNTTTVMLLNPSPCSKYWHDYIFDGYDQYHGMKLREGVSLRYQCGRWKFDPPVGIELGPKGNRPRYDNVLVIFRPVMLLVIYSDLAEKHGKHGY